VTGKRKPPASVDVDRLAAAHERRLAGLDAFVVEHEAEHGQITGEEMEAVVRRAREPRKPR
jgi:hypothetical protein